MLMATKKKRVTRKKKRRIITKKKIKRISTGIKELDKIIGSGFIDNSINMVVGGAGSGKTIFAIQFLIEGLKKGQSCIYITFEEKKEEIYEEMSTFGWDLAKYERNKKLTIVEYTPEQVKRLLSEGGGTIESIISRTKATRIVIDSITSFSLLYKKELSKKEASLALFDLIRKWDCTALLTAEDEALDINAPTSSDLEFEVDGIILLYHIKQKGIRIRALEVLKMRGTKHPAKTFPMDITSKGIKINTRRIVKI